MNNEIYRGAFDALMGCNIAHFVEQSANEFSNVLCDYAKPSAIYRPVLTQDGNAWLAVYGDLPTGVVGCGDTPADAMADFDRSWNKKAVAPPK